jgi:hypothetical protein
MFAYVYICFISLALALNLSWKNFVGAHHSHVMVWSSKPVRVAGRMCLDSSLGHLVAYASEFFLVEASERNQLSTTGKSRLDCQSKAR